jgi:hypothetical protein
MYDPMRAIGDNPTVKRAIAACTERSMISASAVDAYESRMKDGSGGGVSVRGSSGCVDV